jgi:hypothetical protein
MASNSAHKKAVKKVDKQLKKEIKNKESTFDFYAMMPTAAIPRQMVDGLPYIMQQFMVLNQFIG